jgi:hypothetical protein
MFASWCLISPSLNLVDNLLNLIFYWMVKIYQFLIQSCSVCLKINHRLLINLILQRMKIHSNLLLIHSIENLMSLKYLFWCYILLVLYLNYFLHFSLYNSFDHHLKEYYSKYPLYVNFFLLIFLKACFFEYLFQYLKLVPKLLN